MAIGVVLIGLYALAGFVLAPKLVRGQLIKAIDANLGLKAGLGEIRINPFLFQVEIKNFVIPDAAGAPLVGFDRLFVDFELSSIWHRAYTFSEIQIDKPFGNAVVAPDGQLNLRALQPKPQLPAPPPKPEEALPAIQIHDFSVTHGFVTYNDRSRASAFEARIDPISFELTDFTTGSEGGRFKFAGVSKVGERLEWQGRVSLQPLASDGDFRVIALQASTLYDYLKQQLAFVVRSGSIDLNGHYQFALRKDIDLHVDLAELTVHQLAIGPLPAGSAASAGGDWISLPSITLNSTTVDLATRKVGMANLTVIGAKLDTWLDKNGTLNLLQLAGPPPQAAVKPAASAAPVTAQVTATPTPNTAPRPWQVELGELDIQAAHIAAEDRSTTPVAKVLLAPLSLKVKGASLDLAKPVAVEFAARMNESGSVKLAGNLTPQPLQANFDVNLDAIELNTAQPYIAQHTGVSLLDGRLGVAGKLHYAAPPAAANTAKPIRRKPNADPVLSFAGTLIIDRLHTVETALHQDLVNFERLQIAGLKFQHDPDRLQIERITLIKPFARVIIEPDRGLNIKEALADPNAPAGSAPAGGGGAAKAVTGPRKPSSGREAKPEVAANTATTQGTAKLPPQTAAAAPMPISIKQVLVRHGDANFTDLSIKPNFSADIKTLDGSIDGLSSDGRTRAKVDLHGAVDRFSPVSIVGEVNVLSAKLYTDLALDFGNMELTTFNPYSGKFAGYNISKGKLTTELKYKIDGRELIAGHHVVIDQLEFGDKTASKDAVSLPIKLAVALLKDRHGVIELDVPVTGTLDDPKFSYSRIIWHFIGTLLVKIVTAPFALLGSLFGGGADLQFVDFAAGSAQLDTAGQHKMQGVAKALVERPQLKIELPIAEVPELDRPALVEARFEDLVRAAATDVPKLEQLAPKQQLELLSKIYKAQFGAAPKFPEVPAAGAAAPAQPESRAQAKADALQAKIDFLRTALHQHIVVADSDLHALAQRRAEALQRQLLTDTQIEPARVFLVANSKAKAQPPSVRLELSLQ